MPATRNSASSFQNSRRDTGSTPVVGSSSRMTRGSCTSVQASASFCFMPPDSRSARRRAERRQLRHLEQAIARRPVVAHAVDLGEERDVLVDAEVAVQAEALRQIADRAGDRAVIGDRVAAEHADRARRRRAAARTIRRIVVVLPAPSGPISPNISPGRTSNVSAVERGDARRSASVTPSSRTRGSRHCGASDGGSSASTGMPGLSTPLRLSAVTLMR